MYEAFNKPEQNINNDSFFMVLDKNSLEKIDDISGRFMKFRKCLMTVKTHCNLVAHGIITS
jgi:hypothetical protein